MNHGLTVETIPRSITAASQPAGHGGDPSVSGAQSNPATRRHTPISKLGVDRAAVMRSVGRLTYSAGWSSKKAITFDAAI